MLLGRNISPRRGSAYVCRGCGCDDDHACPGGCAWVLLDIGRPFGICSACAEEFEWSPHELATAGLEELAHLGVAS